MALKYHYQAEIWALKLGSWYYSGTSNFIYTFKQITLNLNSFDLSLVLPFRSDKRETLRETRALFWLVWQKLLNFDIYKKSKCLDSYSDINFNYNFILCSQHNFDENLKYNFKPKLSLAQLSRSLFEASSEIILCPSFLDYKIRYCQNHSSTQHNLNFRWVLHENDFAHPTTPQDLYSR